MTAKHAWMAVGGPVRFGVGVDAGVVDDGVERSERVDVGGEASGLVEVGEVTDHHAAGVGERPEVVSALTVAGVEDDVVAAVAEADGGGEAEAGGGSRHEDPGHQTSSDVSSAVAVRMDATGSLPGVAAHQPSTWRRSADDEPGSAV